MAFRFFGDDGDSAGAGRLAHCCGAIAVATTFALVCAIGSFVSGRVQRSMRGCAGRHETSTPRRPPVREGMTRGGRGCCFVTGVRHRLAGYWASRHCMGDADAANYGHPTWRARPGRCNDVAPLKRPWSRYRWFPSCTPALRKSIFTSLADGWVVDNVIKADARYGIGPATTSIDLSVISLIIAEPACVNLGVSLVTQRAAAAMRDLARSGSGDYGAIGYIGGGWAVDPQIGAPAEVFRG